MTQPIAKNRVSPITAKAPGKSGKVVPPPKVDNRLRYLAIGGGAVAVLLLIFWWSTRSSAQLARVREMQRELSTTPADKMSPEERKAKFEALRAERSKLSDSEQKVVRQETGQQMQQKFAAEAVAYLKMSPAERKQVVDRKLAREQSAQKKTPGTPGPVPAGVMASGNPGGGPGGGGPGGPGGGPKTMNPEDRDNRRRSMLLHMSPDARAGMDQMRVDMAVRRAQLGLPANPGKGGR